MNFSHSGIVRTMKGTVKIFLSPKKNINGLLRKRRGDYWGAARRVGGTNIPIPDGFKTNNTIGVISFSWDNTESVELKEMSKKKGLNYFEEERICDWTGLPVTSYMCNMYMSPTDINCIKFIGIDHNYHFYISQIGDDYFLIQIYTLHYTCDLVYRDYIITDIISHNDEYLRIVSEI